MQIYPVVVPPPTVVAIHGGVRRCQEIVMDGPVRWCHDCGACSLDTDTMNEVGLLDPETAIIFTRWLCDGCAEDYHP